MEKIQTPRGTLKIQKTYPTTKEAKENGYGYYFTYNNIDIYIKSIDENGFRNIFVAVNK